MQEFIDESSGQCVFFPEKEGYRLIGVIGNNDYPVKYRIGYFHGWHKIKSDKCNVTVAIIEFYNGVVRSFPVSDNQFKFFEHYNA